MIKVYTEDNILVQNIFVYKIPKNLKEYEIHKYFKQFGEILKIRLDDKPSKRRAGFINFAKPIAAAKTLQRTDHYLKSQRICVKAGNSWHQPAVIQQQQNVFLKRTHQLVDDYYLQTKRICINVENENNNFHTETTIHQNDGPIIPLSTINNITMLNLNDDCLLNICKLLNLHDQLNFARAGKRFCNVFKLCSKLEYRCVDLDITTDLTLWELRMFFEIAGSNIEVLFFNGSFRCREIMKFSREYCPQIKIITFKMTMVTARNLRKLFNKLTDVTVVNLKSCNLNDKCILALKNLKKLKSLTLSENFFLTGLHLNKLKTIEELDLYACGNIQSIYFEKIFQSLKKLHTLDIRRCKYFSSTFFSKMITDCQKLEVLKISIPDIEYKKIAQLPELRHLELLDSSYIMELQFFNTLVQYKSQKLEYLKIISKNYITHEIAMQIAQLKQLKHLICANNDYLNDDCLRQFSGLENLEELVINNCRAITNHGLLMLMCNCKKLQCLDIERCANITNEFVFDAINIIDFQMRQVKEPLLLFAAKTCITLAILNDSRFLAAASILKLSFDNAPTALHDSASESFLIGIYDINEQITEADFFNVDNYVDTDDDDDSNLEGTNDNDDNQLMRPDYYDHNAEDWQ